MHLYLQCFHYLIRNRLNCSDRFFLPSLTFREYLCCYCYLSFVETLLCSVTVNIIFRLTFLILMSCVYVYVVLSLCLFALSLTNNIQSNCVVFLSINQSNIINPKQSQNTKIREFATSGSKCEYTLLMSTVPYSHCYLIIIVCLCRTNDDEN